jgi:hypothetical protein
MKKVTSILAVVAFLFAMNVTAQEQEPKAKKKAKTEKTTSTTDKKSCSEGEKKAGCCSKKAA